MRMTAEQHAAHQARVKGKPSGVDIDAVHAKRSKHGNVKTTFNGKVYDSIKEAKRAAELQILQQAGEIYGLSEQRSFALVVNDQLICEYVCDFTYRTNEGVLVVEDVKSEHTRKLPVYRIKKKLMAACLGIEIKEV